MSDNPIHHAAALLEGAHQRSLELAGDDLLSPWATLATRTALVVSLLSPAATAITPDSSGSVSEDLREAMRLLTAPGSGDGLPIDDIVTARRWLSELIAEATQALT